MSQFKYNVGDKVRIVSCGEQMWWYADLVGNEYTITGLRTLRDGPNYAVERVGANVVCANVVSEYDVELVVVAQPVVKNLQTIAEEVASLDYKQAEAEAALKTITVARETLLKELQGFGLTLVGLEPVFAPIVAQTMRELYHSGSIMDGDQFTWTGATDHGRDWTLGKAYTVMRVDYDNSVSMTTDNVDDESWAWLDEGHFDKFVKA